MKLTQDEEKLILRAREAARVNRERAMAVVIARREAAEATIKACDDMIAGKRRPFCTCGQQSSNPNCPAYLCGYQCD